MANITPQMVKELREKTGAGMGDCKKALVENDGDMEKAIEYLRKKGAASAAKRADRSANEGTICAKTNADGGKAAIVEVNCETDFVAINAEFVEYANKLADAILDSDVTTIDELMKVNVAGDTVEGLHNEILAKFSEKIEIKRFNRIISNGFISAYIHAGNKLGVLLEVSEKDLSDTGKSLTRDIAMQVAAMNPLFIDISQVPADVIEKEKEIYSQQAQTEGKKPEIAERIALGRIEKFYTENCLIEQAFVKDGNKNIKDVVKDISDDAGKDVKVNSFTRYFLGEN